MKLGLELENLFCAEETAVAEGGSSGGATLTALDNYVKSGEYSLTDPGYEGDVEKPSAKHDEPAKTDKTETAEENSGSETTDESATEADKKPAGEDEEADGKEAATDEEEAFTDELLDRAVELGYTFAEIKHFRSRESLERDLDRAERLAQRIAFTTANKAANEAVKGQKDTQLETQAAEPDWDAKKAEGYDEWQIDQMKQDYLRSVGAQQKAMEAHEEIAKLRQQTSELQAQRELEAVIASEQRFEAMIDGLGKEYKSLLGKGSGTQLKKSSQEFKNRREVFQEMMDRAELHKMRGKSVPSETDLFDRAVASVFNGHSKALARKELKEDIKDASSQALVRTSSAATKPARNVAAAVEKTERYLHENT